MNKKFLHICMVVLSTSVVSFSAVAAEIYCQTLYDKCKDKEVGCKAFEDWEKSWSVSRGHGISWGWTPVSEVCKEGGAEGCDKAIVNAQTYAVGTFPIPSYYCHGAVDKGVTGTLYPKNY